MKSYSLTSTRQKIGCVLINLFFVLFNLFVLTSADAPSIWLMLVFAFFTLVLCVFYTWIVFLSVIRIDAATKKICYRIIRKTHYDLTRVKFARIEKRIIDKNEKDCIALYDERGHMLGEINPFLTKHTLKNLPEILSEIERVMNL